MAHLIQSHPPTPFLAAKHMALELQAEIAFFVAENICGQGVAKVGEIVGRARGAEEGGRGEVYLITCMAIIQIPLAAITPLLPRDYLQCIESYLSGLVQPRRQEKPQASSLSETYAGRLKKSKHRSEEKKRKILDWLFVERIDRVLLAIANEVNQYKTPFKGFNAAVSEQLSKSLALAKTIFSPEEYQEYRGNIQAFLGLQVKPSMASERGRPSSEGKFIIIDESLGTHKQTALTVRKNSIGRMLPSFKSSLKHRMEKTTSINEAMDSTRRNEGEVEKKYSTIHRSSKRGSLSSSCSKRSSAFNRSEEKLGPRVSTRWGNKINIEVVASAFNKNKPFRRSNFQQIRSRELQFVEKDESLFFFKKNSSIIEEEAFPERQIQATIHNLFVDGFLKSLRKMKELYIFLELEGITCLAAVEELKEHEVVEEEDQSEEHFRVRVKVINPNRSTLVLVFPQLHRGSLSKEITCLKAMAELAHFYRNDLKAIRANTKDGCFELSEEESNQNIFKVHTASQRILLSFIRKISTHFICICKYQLEHIEGYNQHSFRRRMLEEGRRLRKSVSVQRQLKSTDLTLDFRIEPPSSIRRGSAIEYIEREEDQAEELSYYKDGCPIKLVQSTAKELYEVPIRTLWENSQHRQRMEQERHKRHRKGNSKLQKFMDRQGEGKRLKRVGMNKNSIKMMTYVNDFELAGFPQAQFFKTHQNQKQSRNYSKKDLNQSEKRIAERTARHNHSPREEKVVNSSRKRHFIESIRTDKGYQLILHKETQQIGGRKYEHYFGYRQRNPKHCCYYKEEASMSIDQHNFYKPTLSIHGNKKRNIDSTSLITFTKMITSEEGFEGYVISTIKILPNSVNSDIFIETYWQAKQKYFVFVVSADVFEKLTEINTRCFEEKPFLASSEIPQISKKRERKTSVVASLMKERETELLKQSSPKLKRNRFMPDDSAKEIPQLSESFSRQHKRRYDMKTLTSHQMQTMGRVIKTVDTCSTSKHMKNSLRGEAAALRREVVSRLRNKIVKLATFVWKNYRLYFQLKYNIPTQLDSISIIEFQGSELALKNAYHSARANDQLQATELILVKYQQSSLANLNFYSAEGLNKIYLEHVFIKNSTELYSRYTAAISIRELIEDQRVSVNYRDNNSFFEHREVKHSINHLRSFASKTSVIDDQRKLKYQQVLEMARKCSIPIREVNKKKRRLMAQKFIVPNRYEYFQSEDYLLQVEVSDEEIIVRNLQCKVLRTISVAKLEKILLFVRRWPLKTFTRVIASRILKDEDLLNLCSEC